MKLNLKKNLCLSILFLLIFLTQGCMAPPSGQGSGGSYISFIIKMTFMSIIYILPIVSIRNKGKNYLKNYIGFLNKNGDKLTTEDQNLITALVKNNYKIITTLSISSIVFWGILFSVPIFYSPIDEKYEPYIIGSSIFILLLLILNFILVFLKLQRLCPFCKNKVTYDTDRCSKCTKDISNNWLGKPMLEQFHKN